MHLTFRVSVNHVHKYSVATPDDVEELCKHVAAMPAFVTMATPEGESGTFLTVIAESGRASVDFMDLGRAVKLASQDENCTRRGFVWLKNDAYPQLELDQIEVQYRGLIARERAMAILRHYLTTGEPTDMVPWPPEDWDYWCGPAVSPDPPDQTIPF